MNQSKYQHIRLSWPNITSSSEEQAHLLYEISNYETNRANKHRIQTNKIKSYLPKHISKTIQVTDKIQLDSL